MQIHASNPPCRDQLARVFNGRHNPAARRAHIRAAAAEHTVHNMVILRGLQLILIAKILQLIGVQMNRAGFNAAAAADARGLFQRFRLFFIKTKQIKGIG